MLSNATLAIAIETLSGTSTGNAKKDDEILQSKQHVYFSIVLWSTFILAMVRFIGVCCPDPPPPFYRTNVTGLLPVPVLLFPT